jgi:ubiquinone/menaquinone biosynthesis C-methylase UbiE
MANFYQTSVGCTKNLNIPVQPADEDNGTFCSVPTDDVNALKRFELCNYLKTSECMEYYRIWSKFYDVDAKKVGYNGPACTVRHVPRIFHNKNVKLLDMCAGTGGCAIELERLGYTNIDALDGCENMLGLAKMRNLYRNYFLHYLYPSQQTSVGSEKYDGVICSGGFVNGHLRPEVCQEFLRVLKPGGYCIIGMRESFLHIVDEYKDSLEPYMNAMTGWTLVERIEEPHWFGNLEGVIFVYQKHLLAN